MDKDLLAQLVQQANILTSEVEYNRAKKDPYFFLTNFCYTMDEHWQEKGLKDPFQLFPKKEYVQDLCDIFVTENLIIIEKTRQMMASWIMCGLALWFTMFNQGRRTFLMSKKEKDANALVDRCKVIYSRLPKIFKDRHPSDPDKYLQIRWGKQDSIIEGIPQGPDQVRSYTSSLIIMDEAAFQDKAHKVFEAAQPSIQGGGKFVALSTTNGREWFWQTVSDVE